MAVQAGSGTSVARVDADTDGTHIPIVSAISSNIVGKFRDAFEVYEPNTGGRWSEAKASGDLVYVDGNAVAASYLIVSKDPLSAGTETAIETVGMYGMPIELAFGASLSQRTLGQEFAVELVSDQPQLPNVADLEIAAITQATTTLTVTTVLPHGLSVGKSIGVRGVVDSRLNYPALVVATVPAPTQFTATAGPGGTIASVTAFDRVLAATTAALPTATYANGTLGVGATLTATANGAFPNQDGVAIPLGGRVLVKNEVAGANNGVYTLTTVGNAGAAWVLTRATDFDVTAEMTVSATVPLAVAFYVAGGTTQGQRTFYLSATVTTVGTTAVTFTDSGVVAPLGYVFFRERLGRAQNGVSQIFENGTATNASLYIRSESGDALPSGTIAGSHAATVGSTAPVALVTAPYAYAFSPTTEFRINVQADRSQWYDSAVDVVTQTTSRLLRTQVCPDPAHEYKLRIRATNNKSLTVPAAQIVSANKPTSATCTVTTDRPHGLVAGDLIVAYGTRLQTAATDFQNLTTATPVLSTPSATTFTVTWGTASVSNLTTYGGYVARVQGGNLMSALGAQAVVAQSAVLLTLVDGTRQLVLTGNTNWGATLSIGDMAEVVGLRDAVAGATLGCDGPWKVANNSTTALTLVLPFSGQRTLPVDFASTNCGGGVIKRTCLRLSFVRLFDYERQRVELLARPTGDMSAAAPVAVQNTPAVTMTSTTVAGTAAVDSPLTNPVVAGGRASNTNITAMSAAGDIVAQLMTMIGALVVKTYSIPEADFNVALTITTNAAVDIQTAAGAGIKRYLTAFQYQNTNATATTFALRQGTTVLANFSAPASMAAPIDIVFPTPLQTAANATLNIIAATTGANLLVNAQGYTAP